MRAGCGTPRGEPGPMRAGCNTFLTCISEISPKCMGPAQLAWLSVAHQKTLIRSSALGAPHLAILAHASTMCSVTCSTMCSVLLLLTGFVKRLSEEECLELARI